MRGHILFHFLETFMYNIVILEADTMGFDISWQAFEALGNVTLYRRSTDAELAEKLKDADIAIANKLHFNADTIGMLDRLKMVALTATGTDNLDKPYLESRGIAWSNAVGYSTEPVAQHTFALLFGLMEQIAYYDRYVKSGEYVKCPTFTHYGPQIQEVYQKTWGIIGLGNIGRKVAQLAEAFGAKVIYYSTTGRPADEHFEQVSFEELLQRSDIVTVHCPLTENTRALMNAEAFAKMKPTAFFINVGRGPIVDNAALAEAINNGEIAGAGLDVFEKEPIAQSNPLLSCKYPERLLLTPHIAWASIESRERLMAIVVEHVKNFIETTNGFERR